MQDRDVLIEAVTEHPKVKAEVLIEAEKYVQPETVIASNTSTIPITQLANTYSIQERFCGMHFFNPVPKMPLVEVIKGEKTSDQTIATVCGYAQKLGKTPDIVAQDCTGFFVNRVLFPYFAGFNLLLRDGGDFHHIDKIIEKKFGFPMGQLNLLDVVGLDTAYHAQSIMAQAYPERMQPQPKNAVELLFKADRFGQKSKYGFYQYQSDKKGKLVKTPDPATATLLEDYLGDAEKFSPEDIIARCLIPLILEAVRCLDEGVIGSPAEDMALLYGIGFPAFRGGAFHYINELGTAEFVSLVDKFQHLGPLYHIPESLRQRASRNLAYGQHEEEGNKI